jgi:hypothetical protein
MHNHISFHRCAPSLFCACFCLTNSCTSSARSACSPPSASQQCISALYFTSLCCAAYLCTEEEEPLPEPLQAAFGGVNGRNILDMLVTVSQHSLVAFQGETELHRQVSRFRCCVLVAKIPSDA